MEKLQARNDHDLIHCRVNNENNNNTRVSECIDLNNRLDDPLSEPEVTVNLNTTSLILPANPIEEPEEDLFDYEGDSLAQDGNTDSEEQVVPSSQLSSTHKYPDDIAISDDEIDEGIFEDDQLILDAEDTAEIDDTHRHNSQPP